MKFILVAILFISHSGLQSQEVEKSEFLSPGTFIIGANYWASHAGPAMWSDWRADIVEQDFRKLSENGIKMLRVFPNWKDFQPISLPSGVCRKARRISFWRRPFAR